MFTTETCGPYASRRFGGGMTQGTPRAPYLFRDRHWSGRWILDQCSWMGVHLGWIATSTLRSKRIASDSVGQAR
eukprot:5171152-Pyramimonas_sp.AAC.1